MKRVLVVSVAAMVAVAGLAGCGSSSKAKEKAAATTSAAEAKSAADLGGMDALIAAAKKEGQLNVITLPHDWANYGEILKAFSDKYGIKLDEANPDGSSSDEINAVKSLKGQDRAPDVLDLGSAFALSGAKEDLFAPYKVAKWDEIPANQKDADGKAYNDYGGFVSIGCDAKKIAVCPTSFADLLKPEYKGKVALNGNPTKSGSAFAGVYAAALANGGSFDNIQPGIDWFAKLKQAGNFLPVESTPATIEKGETPISIDWDYLNAGYADKFKDKGIDWKVAVPSDGKYANYYNQAISKSAPHPAAARLWEEFLYSDEGQNLWLKGYARPVRLPKMTAANTAKADLVAKLPKVEGDVKFPTPDQITAVKKVLADNWAKAITS
ncbi:ABC transporter substrate-binding protein [Longispora fulva]|uniref:Putative spermidine/putrescine transport system substrate-binding protein n=1 Tax=Longispora fulva TaxID=619741 RepID=A0A8J7KY29_9ACTN|nr:extracellular solute-binding protein [Longispora fulva]MBG6138707.1 putative spermidine/putrescine transport system substrate-binding protein [Longispora fulva]GIG58200.1 ABC transporter substrate-binding protein [Longispora fulva]